MNDQQQPNLRLVRPDSGAIANYEHDPIDRDRVERAVLGRMIMWPNRCASAALFFCTPDDFVNPHRRLAFEAAGRLVQRGVDPELNAIVVDVAEATGDQRVANLTAAEMNLSALEGFAPENLEHFCRVLMKLSDEARIRKAAAEIAAGKTDTIEAAETFTAMLRDLSAAKHGRPELISDIEARTLSEIEAEQEGRLVVKRVLTGIKDIDDDGGMMSGELWVLAARPGMGKTAMALQLAEYAAMRNERVLFFSLEMSKSELAKRMLVRGAAQRGKRMSVDKLRTARVADHEWGPLQQTIRDSEGMPLEIIDDARVTDMGIVAASERAALIGGGVGLVVVDYLQLVRGSGRFESRELEVASVTRNLKVLARSVSCPVLCLAQLNRESEKRQNKRPILSDLRESGSVEQDANAVLFLYRPHVYESSQPEDEAELIIAKCRHGKLGKVDLFWDGRTQTFISRG
jgi:replicative DNA helicase